MKTDTRPGANAIRGGGTTAWHEGRVLRPRPRNRAWHHEKWDGTLYPRGPRGGDFPTSARLMVLADVFDALISRRVYKPAMSHDQAASIIVGGEGSQFDPDAVEAFLAAREEFRRIGEHLTDAEPAVA